MMLPPPMIFDYLPRRHAAAPFFRDAGITLFR